VNNKILITGGGGFIGNQTAWALAARGYDITIVDRENPRHMPAGLYKVIDYAEFFNNLEEKFDTVIHLAADHIVHKSTEIPSEFYENNVVKMKVMLDKMVELGMNKIIYSSSGGIYGSQGGSALLPETLPYSPINPYASTKAAGELLIRDYSKAYGLKYVNFRYFNAAGADPSLRFGYVQNPATHVIPILCKKILTGEEFSIYGNDYDTFDGTCVRDYVHVADIANAHVLAVEFLCGDKGSETLNLGSGVGISVYTLVKFAEKLTGKKLNISYKERRPGDPAVLTADIHRAKSVLDWAPNYNIEDMLEHALGWEKKYASFN